VASKQVNHYDLSDKGRTSGTPDSSQPGYGNVCFGNRQVTSIENSTLGTDGNGPKTVAVNLPLSDCKCCLGSRLQPVR